MSSRRGMPVKNKESIIRISIICTMGCFMAGLVYESIRAENEQKRIAENLIEHFRNRWTMVACIFTASSAPPINDRPGQ